MNRYHNLMESVFHTGCVQRDMTNRFVGIFSQRRIKEATASLFSDYWIFLRFSNAEKWVFHSDNQNNNTNIRNNGQRIQNFFIWICQAIQKKISKARAPFWRFLRWRRRRIAGLIRRCDVPSRVTCSPPIAFSALSNTSSIATVPLWRSWILLTLSLASSFSWRATTMSMSGTSSSWRQVSLRGSPTATWPPFYSRNRSQRNQRSKRSQSMRRSQRRSQWTEAFSPPEATMPIPTTTKNSTNCLASNKCPVSLQSWMFNEVQNKWNRW